jgi:hypothetical protein
MNENAFMQKTCLYWTFALGVSLVALATIFPVSVVAQDSPASATQQTTPPTGDQNSSSFKLPANVAWYDTKIDLTSGQSVTITASGTVTVGALIPANNVETPAGKPALAGTYRPGGDLVAQGLSPWSLVGRIGSGKPFEVGTSLTFTPTASGRLYLSVNDNNFFDNGGSWNVTVTGGTKASPPLSSSSSTSSGPIIQTVNFDPVYGFPIVIKGSGFGSLPNSELTEVANYSGKLYDDTTYISICVADGTGNFQAGFQNNDCSYQSLNSPAPCGILISTWNDTEIDIKNFLAGKPFKIGGGDPISLIVKNPQTGSQASWNNSVPVQQQKPQPSVPCCTLTAKTVTEGVGTFDVDFTITPSSQSYLFFSQNEIQAIEASLKAQLGDNSIRFVSWVNQDTIQWDKFVQTLKNIDILLSAASSVGDDFEYIEEFGVKEGTLLISTEAAENLTINLSPEMAAEIAIYCTEQTVGNFLQANSYVTSSMNPQIDCTDDVLYFVQPKQALNITAKSVKFSPNNNGNVQISFPLKMGLVTYSGTLIGNQLISSTCSGSGRPDVGTTTINVSCSIQTTTAGSN